MLHCTCTIYTGVPPPEPSSHLVSTKIPTTYFFWYVSLYTCTCTCTTCAQVFPMILWHQHLQLLPTLVYIITCTYMYSYMSGNIQQTSTHIYVCGMLVILFVEIPPNLEPSDDSNEPAFHIGMFTLLLQHPRTVHYCICVIQRVQ